MKVLAPRVVRDDMLTTNLAETDSVPWMPSTSYPKNARVRLIASFNFTIGTLQYATLTRPSPGTYTALNGQRATAGPNEARFECRNGVCIGVLIEPQRTNIVVYSSAFDNAAWSKQSGGAGAAVPIVTADASVALDGTMTADRIQCNRGTAAGGYSSVVQNTGAGATGETWTGSIDLRSPGGTVVMPIYLIDSSGGFTRQDCLVSSTTQRFTVTRLLAGPAVSLVVGCHAAYGGAQTFDAYCSAAQLEQGGTATSHIPTSDDVATRAADAAVLDWSAKGGVDGFFTLRPTFDNGSTQDIPVTIMDGKAPVPAASLNRYVIATARLAELLDSTRIYQSIQPDNLSHALTDVAWWQDIAPTNRWALFDGAIGSLSHANGSFSVSVKLATAIDSLAILDITAATVRVQIVANGATVYDTTTPISAAGAALTLFGLPAAANATVTITVAGAGNAAVSAGTLLIGNLIDLGLTEAGPQIGITDFSRRETDDFGVTTVVERGWAKRMTLRSQIPTAAVDDLQRQMASLRAYPSLWIGEEGYDSLFIYGFFKSFSIDLALETISFCSLEIEGMTSAS